MAGPFSLLRPSLQNRICRRAFVIWVCGDVWVAGPFRYVVSVFLAGFVFRFLLVHCVLFLFLVPRYVLLQVALMVFKNVFGV